MTVKFNICYFYSDKQSNSLLKKEIQEINYDQLNLNLKLIDDQYIQYIYVYKYDDEHDFGIKLYNFYDNCFWFNDEFIEVDSDVMNNINYLFLK